MKLIIKRNQKEQKGIFGGHKGMTFLLSFRVELTQEEQDLIKKYKTEEEPITVDLDNPNKLLTIRDMIEGKTYERRIITTVLDTEDRLKEACKNFKLLLRAMASFGGEEVIEF
jgi:hypothetical protein